MTSIFIGATRNYGGDWFRELTVEGVTFLAPLDEQDKARHVLSTASGADGRTPVAWAVDTQYGRAYSFADEMIHYMTGIAESGNPAPINPAPPTSAGKARAWEVSDDTACALRIFVLKGEADDWARTLPTPKVKPLGYVAYIESQGAAITPADESGAECPFYSGGVD